MTDWGWRPERTMGIWRHGAGWTRPIVAAAPYLTVLLLLLQFFLISGVLTVEKGVLFDLPEQGMDEGAATDLVALVVPMRHETMVFFDDSRYLLGDAASVRTLGEHVAARASRSELKSLLILADRRVSGGDLMTLAAVLRRNGIKRLLFAEKRAEANE